jgi:hypothetical protein
MVGASGGISGVWPESTFEVAETRASRFARIVYWYVVSGWVLVSVYCRIFADTVPTTAQAPDVVFRKISNPVSTLEPSVQRMRTLLWASNQDVVAVGA